MFLDYLVIPIVSVVYGAISIQKVRGCAGARADAPDRGGARACRSMRSEWRLSCGWSLLVCLTTFLNVRGIQWTAHTNQILTG